MKLILRRRVRSDVDEIMEYYERAEHSERAQDFYRELCQTTYHVESAKRFVPQSTNLL